VERVWREGPKNSDKFPLTANSFICYLILADSADKIEVSGMKRIKRNCGSQKGNQNARNRGFYAFTLTPAELARFLNILALNRMLPFCVESTVLLLAGLRSFTRSLQFPEQFTIWLQHELALLSR